MELGRITRTQCPQCRDSGKDNLVTHKDGSRYCYACGYRPDKEEEYMPELLEPGRFTGLKSRKISKSTCEKFGVTANRTKEGNPVVVFNHFSKGELVKQKIRDIKDTSTCRWLGDTSDTSLFGMHAFHPNDKFFITLTEGEMDAMSIYEATGYPAVSITKGAQGSISEIKENLEWLSKWKYVVIAFDNDKVGRDAAQKVLNIFEPGKARTCFFPLKDANDMLFANREQEIKSLLWQAEEYFPEDLVTAEDVLDQILEDIEDGKSWPYPDMTECTHGLRSGEIYVVAAGTSVGKSTLIKELIAHQIYANDLKCAMFSFEQSVSLTFKYILGTKLNLPLQLPETVIDKETLKVEALKLQDNLIVFDRRVARESLLTFDDIVNKIKVLVKVKGVSVVVIDNLKAISATLDDQLHGMEKVMVKLQALSASLGVTFIVVSHLAKDKRTGKAGDEAESWGRGRKPVLENIYGSSAIEAIADFVFALSRNADSEDPSTQMRTTVQCLKSRLDGTKRGKEFEVVYNAKTGRLL